MKAGVNCDPILTCNDILSYLILIHVIHYKNGMAFRVILIYKINLSAILHLPYIICEINKTYVQLFFVLLIWSVVRHFC